MVAPGVKGYPGQHLNNRLPFDVEGAKRRLVEAGYPQGFEIGMNCPNDRYVNDEEICQAVAAMLAKIDRQGEPDDRIEGDVLPKDPVAQHELLSARLDAVDHRRPTIR